MITVSTRSSQEFPTGPVAPRLTVSVIPPWRGLANNGLFESRRDDDGPHRPNAHWLDCFAAVYERARRSNILFGTADVLPKDEADVVVYMSQPNSPRDVLAEK